jgi:DNA-binding CsgD family transcriptional regulator/PAS domain-containing protein
MADPLLAERELLSDLIGRIYDCAIDVDRWPATMSILHETLGFSNAAMSVMSITSGRHIIHEVRGVEPVWLERMADYNRELLDLWGGPARAQTIPLDEPAVLSRVTDRTGWESNRYYTEWGRPQGLIDVMALPLARNAEWVGTIGMGRHETAGEIGAAEVTLARLLLPHLQRSVEISRLLELQTVAAQTFRATLDTLTVGVVLVDAELHILHTNKAADAMLSTGDPVRVMAGRLGARAPMASAALAEAVRQAGESEAALGRRGFGIPVPQADRTPCLLQVLPLQAGALRSTLFDAGAAAAVFIASPAAPVASPAVALAAMFDLTAAESRVLASIAAGRSVQETAAAMDVATSTVKTHLLRVFTKTGTRRQADLVRLFTSLALPV